MFLLLARCLAFSICHILKQVAHTRSTTRPMTSEEFAAAGVSPTREEIHNSENIQSRMEDPALSTIHDSGSREDGEIRSENKSDGEEDLSNVDVDLNDCESCISSPSFCLQLVKGYDRPYQRIRECRIFPYQRRTSPFWRTSSCT
jgi:hypothetical protein